MDESAPPAWQAPALGRVVSDLLAAELAQARPGRVLPPRPWPEDLDLAADLGADSLDLMAAATSLADFLGAAQADALIAARRLGDWIAAAQALAARPAAGARLVFRTSGSSGTPKRCPHALAALWREAAELARILPGRTRILAAVPAHHIYGFLWTVLLPQAYGAPLPVADLRGASPAALPALLAPGDLVVAYPDYWDALAALAPAIPPGVAGVSSTAPLGDATARALGAAGLRLVQVYGSSETAGVGWRDSPDQPYRLFSYWRRDGEDRLAREGRGADGEGGVVALQDRLDWRAGDAFLPAGRRDAAVQVAGTNVFPAYVAEVLALHPQVLECAVRPMRPDEGSRLKAFVVARAGSDAAALRAALDAWMRARLVPAERPAAFSFGAALPRQPNGKLADWIIEAWE